ncbi:hypothetical protein [Echinicola salinicaeni]|uniref:hypothetical protein n=1 Tax=Echinicola salinicaeni TaxID=2762757 RepID=UPI0016475DB1|nr:hypothetical protein [Echinicola salinicaeni]
MKCFYQICIFCLFSLLIGCNDQLKKAPNSENLIVYNLIASSSNENHQNDEDEFKIGKVFLTPDQQEQVFKIKTIISHSIKTSGYQVFVNGESNYKLLDYNTPYFCIGDVKDPKSIKIRLRLDNDHFITAKLSGTKSYASIKNMQKEDQEIFPQ